MIESEVLEVRVGDVHVTPEQVADANIGTFGPDDYVLSTGRKLEAQVVTNNSVRVFDGVMVYGGIRDVISVNKYYDIQIDNGAQGMNRNDIIVRHFAITDEVTKRGGATFQVIKGTPSEGEAADPEIAFTDLRAGALSHDMILHRVRIEGLNIVAVEPLYDILYNAAELKKEVTKLNRKLQADNDWSTYSDNGWTLKYRHITANLISVEASRTSTGNNAAVVGNLVMAGIPFDVAFSQNVQCAMDVSGNIVGNGRARFADNNGLYLYTPGYGNPVTYTAFGIVSVK